PLSTLSLHDALPISRILIVEDEEDLAGLIEYNLQQEGFETERAPTGASALSRARALPPDLVLLDLMLPDLAGTDVLRMLKSDAATKRCAVVVVSAKGQESDRVQGLELGADDYIVKPFSVRELLLRVKAVLRRGGEGQGSVERPGAGPGARGRWLHRTALQRARAAPGGESGPAERWRGSGGRNRGARGR